MQSLYWKILFIFFIFWNTNSNSQTTVDSLNIVLTNPKLHDTTRLATLALFIDNLYENKEIAKYNILMGRLAQKGLLKSKNDAVLKKKYIIYIAAYYNNISFLLEQKRNPKSLFYLNKSIELYKSIDSKDEYYTALVSKGLLLSRNKRYREAIDCYFSALKYFELNEKENADGISYVYANLGGLYGDQGQNETSIKYLKKAIFYIDKKEEGFTLEDELQKSAMCYNIGTKYVSLKKYKEAEQYLNVSVLLSKKHNQMSYLSFALGKLAEIDMFFKRYDAAEKKLLKAKEIVHNGKEIVEKEHAEAFILLKLGHLYFEKKQYDEAKENLENGLFISKQIMDSDLLLETYRLLYQLNKIQGNYKESIEQLELYNVIKDSSKVVETKNELKQQQLKYDYKKKELNYKLESQKKSASKNILLIGLSSLLLLVLIGVYFFYRNYKQKQAISVFEKNELNQKLLLTQMNPHFIFNSIDNIQILIRNEQNNEAVSYLNKFSKLTRQILENSSESYISLEEELTMIDNFLVIQQLLYNNKFEYSIDVDESITTELILLPPMLTQPLIENAIKHGLKDIYSDGMITIRFYMQDNKLIFEVKDNGSGFTYEEKVGKSKSLAMKITKERLRIISKKTHFEVHAKNLLDANSKVIGAKVYFEIPYIYEN
jgi:tetratricopeptide (TPR) repeat protein